MKRIIIEMGLILAIAGVAGFTSNRFRAESRKLAWFGTTAGTAERDGQYPSSTVAARMSSTPDSATLYVEIPADAAYRMYGEGALFIDARRSDAYDAGHVAGARSIPVWEHDAGARIDALVKDGTPFDRTIVVYCSGPACEDSARLAEMLALAGFYRISVYTEGFPDWRKSGWPVDRGPTP